MGNMTPEPLWLTHARKYIGQKEIAGVASNKWILSLWDSVPWIWASVARKDDTLLPWCGAFMRLIMISSGQVPPKKWWSAAEWAKWGTPLKSPVFGCVYIRKRDGGAHVTLMAGKNNAGYYCCIGGNQGDAVKLSTFKPSPGDVFVWPMGEDMHLIPLPILSAAMSTSEA
jgi:uncharacterized protein (TIGR02594 family)